MKMLLAKGEMKEKQFLMGNHSRGWAWFQDQLQVVELFSEKWRKENGTCSVEENEKFDLEGKKDRHFIRDIPPKKNMGSWLREVGAEVLFMSLRKLKIKP